MPAKDRYHDIVRQALEKEGWDITHDPYTMLIGKAEMHIDLGAEKLLAAEKKMAAKSLSKSKLLVVHP